uniref:Uncharacterized protein n=1 Tax=Opuntia streptacantha TaxID=393608 RepID=A0A7C8ZV99_OPUST
MAIQLVSTENPIVLLLIVIFHRLRIQFCTFTKDFKQCLQLIWIRRNKPHLFNLRYPRRPRRCFWFFFVFIFTFIFSSINLSVYARRRVSLGVSGDGMKRN